MRAGELKRGMFIELENDIWEVLSVERQKIAQMQPHVKAKLKSVVTKRVVERTFISDHEVKEADVMRRKANYVYEDAEAYVFMDAETYEEYRIPKDAVTDISKWFVEGQSYEVVLKDGNPVAIFLPSQIELEVVETPPGVRGDTESGGVKPATLSNGVTIMVPLHIKKGDRIKVNPEKGEYISRA